MLFNPDPIQQAVDVTFSRENVLADHPPILFNDFPVIKVIEHKHLWVFLLHGLSSLPNELLLKIILYGDQRLTTDVCKKLLEAHLKFIHATKRFYIIQCFKMPYISTYLCVNLICLISFSFLFYMLMLSVFILRPEADLASAIGGGGIRLAQKGLSNLFGTILFGSHGPSRPPLDPLLTTAVG